MADIGQEEEVAVPVMQPFAEVDPCLVQRVDEGCLHQTRFIDRAARSVIRARCPLDHPVEDFELAELRVPGRDTFCPQIIYKRLLAGARPHRQQRTQVFVEQVPFLFEAVETARWLFLDSLFEGEQIFVGEWLRGHEGFLRPEV